MKPWDLHIKVAIQCPKTRQIKAVARAELTAAAPPANAWTLGADGTLATPRQSCHECQALSALFPPGESGAVAGDVLVFGPNQFVITGIETLGEGMQARKRYACVRSAPGGGGN